MVTLRRMTEVEFQAFLARNIENYATDKVKAGSWTAEESLHRSREAHSRLLPTGLATQHHHLFTIVLDGESVGNIWLSTDPKIAGGAGFIYDLFVNEPFRRRGVARQAMRLLEEEALRLDVNSLALHVFGHNAPALALYEELGYSITDINMLKPLSAA